MLLYQFEVRGPVPYGVVVNLDTPGMESVRGMLFTTRLGTDPAWCFYQYLPTEHERYQVADVLYERRANGQFPEITYSMLA